MENKKNTENLNLTNYSIGHSIIEFITIIVRYRWFLITFVLTITISATLYALLSPKWYKASTSVLPAEQSNPLSALGGISSLVKSFSPTKGLAALSSNNELDRYIAILKSSRVTDDVIRKFGLRKEYDLEDTYYENTVKEFNSNLEITVADEGNLVVSVYDKDAKRSAEMANFIINRLNEINTQLSIANARANREFIERRYFDNLKEINQLETDMQLFQEKYGVIAVPEQLESTFKAMSEFSAMLAQKEITLNIMRKNYGESNPLVSQAELEVTELRKKIDILNKGNDISDGEVNLLIPFKKAPFLAKKYLKIYKDLEIQYKILEFIQPLYEQAKVEEVRNTPSVIILDAAGVPERKSRPKGSLYLLISLLSSTFIGLLIVFTIEGIKKIKIISPNNYAYIKKSLSLRSKKNKSKYN